MKKKEKTKDLLLRLPSDLHKEIKLRSVIRGITMKSFVLEAIIELIKTQKKYE